MIQAITFDFWDTIAIDDSDEAKRAARGLPSKAEARQQLFVDKVTSDHPHVTPEEAVEAFQYANQRFREQWHKEHRTPGLAARIYDAYRYLGLAPGPGEYVRFVQQVDDLIRAIETMEVRIPPDLAPGIQEALAALSQEHRLGIISDTIHTTGQGLRGLLNRHGLLGYFDYFIFSDEVRAAKPDATVFRQAALGLGVAPSQLLHVGDRESNDVAGPKAMGMWAILYTGVVDRGSQQSQADAICTHHRQLPALVRMLAVHGRARGQLRGVPGP